MIEDFAKLLPKPLLSRSGRVFYSGRIAFESVSNLYIVGMNPGGSPSEYRDDTVSSHTKQILNSAPDNWSAYRDERWGGRKPGTLRPPGTAPMQLRMQHLFQRLQVDSGEVPASNIVFLRSERKATLEGDFSTLASQCWSFHAAVIESLRVRVIVCLGTDAGEVVRGRVGAVNLVDEFVEKNNRGWASRAYVNRNGLTVAVLTHPSIANWATPVTDPTELVLRALRR